MELAVVLGGKESTMAKHGGMSNLPFALTKWALKITRLGLPSSSPESSGHGPTRAQLLSGPGPQIVSPEQLPWRSPAAGRLNTTESLSSHRGTGVRIASIVVKKHFESF
jgi:hypothetical protein